MAGLQRRFETLPIIGGLIATAGTLGAIISVLLILLVLVFLAPLALLWSLNQLGLTDVALLDVWNLLAALIIILVLRGKLGYS